MSTQMSGATVTETITVEAPLERAFRVYTEEMASWWPKDHHLLQGELKTMVFEPRAGGSIYDLGVDGSRCVWSRVLVWEPPTRVVFTWDISTDWAVETDQSRTSEVEVRFIAEGAARTRVELEHRHIDRHGDRWESMRDAVGSPNGWRVGLEAFAEVASQTA